ncbi:MAG: hypothetical protein INR65_08015, partial [Gluconacetobacter diazotrophicus]|nr:hypothetical protein [Gluconacetobacter diazotrophicus]
VLEGERANSDGALSFEGNERTSLFGKLFAHPTAALTVTVAANGQWQRGRIASGATRDQIAAFGPGFGLTNDLRQQNAAPFNGDRFHTDFAYASLRWAGRTLTVEATPYTYGLYRRFANGLDVNGETPNGTAFGAGDLPGQQAFNDLRASGGVLRAERRWRMLSLRAGIWAEHQINSRGQFEIDQTLGGRLNPVLDPVPGVPGSAAIDRLQRDSLDTQQPYLEAEWRPLPGLSVTPGLRWAFAERHVAAPVMEGTRLPTFGDATYDDPLPSVAVRQRLGEHWSGYAQLAQGSLAPPLQLLDTTRPLGDVSGEKTLNMQVGAVRHGTDWSLGLDGYVIQFDDLVNTREIGGETLAFTSGGATYEGVEAEATIGLGFGLSLYGNASLSRARDHDTGAPLPNAPDQTLAGGILFSRGPWSASLLDKWVGSRWGDTGRQAGLDPFNQLDLAVVRTIRLPGIGSGTGEVLRLALQAQNLADSRKIVALAGYTVADGTPLWFTQPGRSFFGTVTATF